MNNKELIKLAAAKVVRKEMSKEAFNPIALAPLLGGIFWPDIVKNVFGGLTGFLPGGSTQTNPMDMMQNIMMMQAMGSMDLGA